MFACKKNPSGLNVIESCLNKSDFNLVKKMLSFGSCRECSFYVDYKSEFSLRGNNQLNNAF